MKKLILLIFCLVTLFSCRNIGKKNETEWFYGRNANNLWKYIPEAIINRSLKGFKKEDWINFCKDKNVKSLDDYKNLCKIFDKLPKIFFVVVVVVF